MMYNHFVHCKLRALFFNKIFAMQKYFVFFNLYLRSYSKKVSIKYKIVHTYRIQIKIVYKANKYVKNQYTKMYS